MINVFMSIKIKWTWRPSFFIVIVVFLLNTFVVWYQQLSWLIYNKSIIITRKRKTHLIESSCSLSEALLPCCLFLSSHCPCPLLSTGWSLSSLFSLPSSSSSNYHYIILIISLLLSFKSSSWSTFSSFTENFKNRVWKGQVRDFSRR